jgi:hypothetical protein
MRQFLLAASAAYPSALPLKAGEFAVTTLVDGVETISADGAAVKDTFYLNLKKASGDTVVLPAYKHHFSFEKSVYEAGTAYTADVTISAPQVDGHYTLILVKKGLKFNERNRWSATVPVKVGDTANAIAAKLGKFFEANANNLNVTVQVADAKITITGNTKGEDFALKGADELLGIAVNETAATAPLNDAAYIADLASKAAADAGYLHTYYDLDVNPGYPLNPLAQNDKADTGFTVFTLRFAVPRQVKTRDEVVHQIVQVAFPTGAGAIATVETILNAIAGNSAAAE